MSLSTIVCCVELNNIDRSIIAENFTYQNMQSKFFSLNSHKGRGQLKCRKTLNVQV